MKFRNLHKDSIKYFCSLNTWIILQMVYFISNIKFKLHRIILQPTPVIKNMTSYVCTYKILKILHWFKTFFLDMCKEQLFATNKTQTLKIYINPSARIIVNKSIQPKTIRLKSKETSLSVFFPRQCLVERRPNNPGTLFSSNWKKEILFSRKNFSLATQTTSAVAACSVLHRPSVYRCNEARRCENFPPPTTTKTTLSLCLEWKREPWEQPSPSVCSLHNSWKRAKRLGVHKRATANCGCLTALYFEKARW